ncbi:unnamed protein product, partial [marine sediment metagenome]
PFYTVNELFVVTVRSVWSASHKAFEDESCPKLFCVIKVK